jgi:hypothetical protein
MTSAVSFCPRCGTARASGARFCGSCGLDLDAATVAPAATLLPASATLPTSAPATNVEPIAGVAWIVSAAMIGYLGLFQLGYVGTILDTGDLQAIAIWNLIAAAITLYFGARLLTKATRSNLRSSIIWAVINVLWNGFEITQGATHWAFIGATVGALTAGVLSLVALQSRAAAAASERSPAVVATLPALAASPTAAPTLAITSRSGSRRSLELLMVVAIIAAVVAGGYLILKQTAAKVPVSGSLSLESDSVLWSPSDCRGIGEFSDISTSAQVTLKNGKGEVMATTNLVLDPGASSASRCSYTFSTQAADADAYSVDVAGRGGVTFQKADAGQMRLVLH